MVVVASSNKGKLREIKEVMVGLELVSMEEVGRWVSVDEDGSSFLENAMKKAKAVYEMTGEAVIADDSGLCISYYDGWPGVMTKRFLGEGKTDEERNVYILQKMMGLEKEKREAFFECVLVYYDGIYELVGKGSLKGNISLEKRGEKGFGFDCIFELEDGRTLAEMEREEKNLVSARYLALIDLKKKMLEVGVIK